MGVTYRYKRVSIRNTFILFEQTGDGKHREWTHERTTREVSAVEHFQRVEKLRDVWQRTALYLVLMRPYFLYYERGGGNAG